MNVAERDARHLVQGQADIGCQVPKLVVGKDRCRPGAGFLRRLEQENDTTLRWPPTSERAADRRKRCRMPVMAAHMALSRYLRLVLGVAQFLDLAHVKPNTLGNTRMLLELDQHPAGRSGVHR